MICPDCGTENASNAANCSFCGFSINGAADQNTQQTHHNPPSHEAICPFCKGRIRKTDTVCQHCASELPQITVTTDHNNPPPFPNNISYPWHIRAARTRHALPNEGVVIPSIPDLGEAPSINWISVLAAPVCMAIIMLLVASFTNATSMLYMLPLQLVSVVVSIINFRSQKGKHKKKEADLDSRYEALIATKETEIKQIAEIQKRVIVEENPSTTECYSIVEKQNHRLWERGTGDDDFLRVRVGKGLVPLCVSLKYPEKRQLQDDHQLEIKARDLAKQYMSIKSAPVLCDLHAMPTLGIIGDRQAELSIARQIIIDITSLHSYEDVKIIMLYPQSEVNEWDIFRFLPHVSDDRHEMRYMVSNRVEATRIFEALNKSLLERNASLNKSLTHNTASYKPQYLLIIADPVYLQNEPILDLLTTNNPALGVSSVFLFNNRANLPPNCSQIIEASQASGVIQGCLFETNNIENCRSFSSEKIDTSSLDRFVRNMAPIRVRMSDNETSLPNSISLLQAHKVRNPESLPIIENWYRNRASDGMSVRIGVRESSEPFYFDIHEKKCGPMGLIAGTTRSGKTELLQTWITEMAIAYSPDEVAFALIDFKGSGLTSPFEGLPHLAGAISNLDVDPDRDDFILRYATSLRREITRRQIVLRDADCDGNILKYHRKYHERLVDEPLPFLMIVIDEFAEIRSQYDDFMKLVESLYATGGSLGMYVLLATQNPGTAVNDKIRANTAFQWCLRVASPQDSKEMLGISDAAYIPEIPGRGYIRVDKMQILDRIQAIWSGAPYDPTKDILSNEIPVACVRTNGTLIFAAPKSRKPHTYVAEVNVIVDRIKKIALEYGIRQTHKVWQYNLPKVVYLDNLEQNCFDGQNWSREPRELWATIGIADLPAAQEQKPLVLNFSSDGHALVYGAPTTGKTTFLYTVLTSLTTKYSPESLRLYLIDFNSTILSAFLEYPHVATCVTSYDDQSKLEKIFQTLETEIRNRTNYFASMNVGTYRAYCDIPNNKGFHFPSIFLVVDGLNAFRKQHEDLLRSHISRIVKEGERCGIYFIATLSEPGDAAGLDSGVKPSMRFVLQMTSKLDYAPILGSGGTTPSNNVGRGIYRQAGSRAEFQTALPLSANSESELMNSIKTLGMAMRQAVKPIVSEISFSTSEIIKNDGINTMAGGPILGFTIPFEEPVTHDFSKFPAIMFTGHDVNIASTRMNEAMKQIMLKPKNNNVIVFGLDNQYLGVERLQTTNELDNYLNSLTTILRERIETWQKDDSSSFSSLQIIIADLPSVLDKLNEESKRSLAFIMRNGKKVNVNMICSGGVEDFSKFYQKKEEIFMWFFNRCIVLVDSNTSQYGDFLDKYIHVLQETKIDGYYLTACESGSMKALPFCNSKTE